MATLFSFINFIYFMVFILIIYLIYVYFPVLFPSKLMQIENLANQNSTPSTTVQDPSAAVQDPSDVLVVPGEDILQNLKLKATNDKNDLALAYVTDYLKINASYRQILTDQQAEQATTKYKSDEAYAPTFLNRIVSKIANSGLPFVGYFAKLYVPYPDSTTCNAWPLLGHNYDGVCRKEFGDDKDFGIGRPSQLVSGQVSQYPGACPGGAMGAGGQGRAVCDFGYQGNKKIPLNSTKCIASVGPVSNAQQESGCRQSAGYNHDYDKGIFSDYVFGVKKYLDAGTVGCAPDQYRAECAVGYAGEQKLKSNSTKCYGVTDWDYKCRWHGNTDPGYGKGGIASQDTWGSKDTYSGGCALDQWRAECAKGYSAGKLIKYNNSTMCYPWTGNFNDHCKSSNDYGSEYILDTRYDNDGKTPGSGPKYGMFAGGCITDQGRGACIKKSDISNNEVLYGGGCGLWTGLSSQWCKNDFGDDFTGVGGKQADCAKGSGRVLCQKVKDLPYGTKMWGIKCGAWDSISDSWCKNDFGDEWIMDTASDLFGGAGKAGQNLTGASNDKYIDDCGGGAGRALCVKAKTQWTPDCAPKAWQWWGDGGAQCRAIFGKNSIYTGNWIDCGKHGGTWHTAKVECKTW